MSRAFNGTVMYVDVYVDVYVDMYADVYSDQQHRHRQPKRCGRLCIGQVAQGDSHLCHGVGERF